MIFLEKKNENIHAYVWFFFKCPPYENTQIHKHKYMDLDQAVVGLLPAFILENARFDAKIPT